jgi:hypothetical protein
VSNDGSTYHGGVVGTVTRRAAGSPVLGAHRLRARELIFTEMTATDEAGKVLAYRLQTYWIA